MLRVKGVACLPRSVHHRHHPQSTRAGVLLHKDGSRFFLNLPHSRHDRQHLHHLCSQVLLRCSPRTLVVRKPAWRPQRPHVHRLSGHLSVVPIIPIHQQIGLTGSCGLETFLETQRMTSSGDSSIVSNPLSPGKKAPKSSPMA